MPASRAPAHGLPARRTKLLGFEDFTARLPGLDFVVEHRALPRTVAGQDPASGVAGRPHAAGDVPAADLWTFTLEDAGTRTLTTRGIRFRKRDYVGPWMTGQAGIQMRVRFMRRCHVG
jgi:putative transposase